MYIYDITAIEAPLNRFRTVSGLK